MKDDHDDTIAQALDISPLNNAEPALPKVVDDKAQANTIDEQAAADIELARLNVHELIQHGQTAFERIMEIADQSQSAKAYEVVAGMFGKLVQAQKDLIDIHRQRKQLDLDQDRQERSATITNNYTFVGSTTDLQKRLDELKKLREQDDK